MRVKIKHSGRNSRGYKKTNCIFLPVEEEHDQTEAKQ